MSLDKLKKTIRPGADRRWTLLFIGDNGNVITLKRFKAIFLATAIVFLVAIGAVAILIFMNEGNLEQSQEYRKRIENSQKQIEKLRHEKEILMARHEGKPAVRHMGSLRARIKKGFLDPFMIRKRLRGGSPLSGSKILKKIRNNLH